MKSTGRIQVFMVTHIHGKPYSFTMCVMASSVAEAKQKAEATFPGYKAY